MVPLIEALRWSLYWSSGEAAGHRAAAFWRGLAGAAGTLRRRQIRGRVILGVGVGVPRGRARAMYEGGYFLRLHTPISIVGLAR